ncbi:MAG TPA: GNAT family N-acetyltransferase [Steroidobacteraceae bacterium]|nr:GNAT family N-acetyltransferase [Steroidobacteraceae bacterium]HRX87885.1 GNAT family N-acetyltransferase [Steroidobacteraceae bacterium]
MLQTERLRLRRYTLEDAPFVLRLLNERSFIDNIGDRGVRSLDDARRYLETGPLASYAAHGFGLWLIELLMTGKSIGMCGLLKRDALPDADLGYALLPEFAAQGFAFEAADATLSYGSKAFGLSRVLAIVSPHNARSIRLLERLGFVFERPIRMSADADEIRLYARDA